MSDPLPTLEARLWWCSIGGIFFRIVAAVTKEDAQAIYALRTGRPEHVKRCRVRPATQQDIDTQRDVDTWQESANSDYLPPLTPDQL